MYSGDDNYSVNATTLRAGGKATFIAHIWCQPFDFRSINVEIEL
jgi:hypothetical protein